MDSHKQSSHLANITSQNRSFRAQITYLSVKNAPVMILHDHILLALDYIQILAPILFMSLSFQKAQETVLSKVVSNIASLLNAVAWINFPKIGSFEIALLSAIGLFMLLKYLLFIHISLVVKGKITQSKPLLSLWRYLFRTQGRIVYCFVSSFWLKAIYVVLKTKDDRSNSQYYTLMIFFSVMMGLEFIFSLYLNIFYNAILPSKQFLSAKDNTIEIISLIQKLVIQILIVALDFTQLSNLWIFTSINFAIDAVRNAYFFKKLPLYSFKALFYKGGLLAIVTSLNISCLITTLIRSVDIESCSLIFAFTTWVILAVLKIFFTQNYLKRKFWRIVLNPSIQCPNKLIHRISAILELRKMTKMHFDFNRNYSWTMLANKSINLKIKEIFKISAEDDSVFDINDKESFNLVLRKYLQKLMETYPKNQFLRLYTAHYYATKLKLIRAPIDILTKLQANSSLQISLNSELLLMEIQNTLNSKYFNPAADHLNLTRFIHEKTLYIQAREKVTFQVDLQIKICNEIKKESPNILQIFNNSQKLAVHRKKTNRFIKETLSLLSDHHIAPLLLYARYHLILNHSANEHTSYTKLYSRKLQKYHQYYEKDKLIPENMFNQDINFTIFSCNEASVGKVFYASKQFTKLLGKSNDSITQINIIKNAPPCYQNILFEQYRAIGIQGEKLLENVVQRGFICNSEKYLVEMDFCIDIHPFVTSEFYVTSIQRFVKSSGKDYMFVLENGDIDCTTQRIAEKLGLFPSLKTVSPGTDFNLQDISKELVEVNNAFNQVYFTENSEQDRQKAQEISALYSATGQGQDVILKSAITTMNLKKKSQFHIREEASFSYNCKVTNIPHGKSLLKLFTFEEKQVETKKTLHLDVIKSPVSQNRKAEIPTFPPKETEDSGYDEIKNELNKSSDDEEEEEVEEKDNGWIDFHAMSSKITTCREPHSSGTQRTTSLMTTHRAHDTGRNLLHLDTKPTQVSQKKPLPVQSTGGKNTKRLDFQIKNQSVATSKWSKFSQQKRIFSLYEVSLKTKYYPKLYKLFFGLFCLSFIVLLMSQGILKTILDKNVQDLQTNKNILRCAENRNYQQVTIESTTRILWDFWAGNLPRSAFGVFAPLVFFYPYLLNSYLLQLGETNQNLLSNTSYLDYGVQERLFVNDVDIYDTYFDEQNQTYTTLNNFQAINTLVETGLQLKNIFAMSIEETEFSFKFLLRNSLNSLLLKNEEISDIMNGSLDDQRRKIESNIQIFLILLLLIFGGFLVLLTWMLWQQYHKQTYHLSAFCRVNPSKLNSVIDDFIRFKQSIQDEEENHATDTVSSSYLKRAQKEKTISQDKVKHDYNKAPDAWDLQKYYYILIAKLVFLILIIMVMVIVTSVISQKSIKSSQTQQTQIFFLDHSKARVGLTSGAILELTSTNNQAYIEDKLVLDELKGLVKEIDDFRLQIYHLLMDNNQNEDFEYIETMLNGDACGLIGPASAFTCNTLVSRGNRPGLIYVLSSFGDLASAVVTEYESSNKTEEALKSIKIAHFEEAAILLLLAGQEIDLLSTLVDERFEKDLEFTNQQRMDIFIGYILLVICVSLLVWNTVLRVFRKSINQFKNVLAVLPGDLVLGSFILRTFLMKTSKGVLDPIKNDL